MDFSSSSLQYPVLDHLIPATSQNQCDHLNILYSVDLLALPMVSFVTHLLLPLGIVFSVVPSYNLGLKPSWFLFDTSGVLAYAVGYSIGIGKQQATHGQLWTFRGILVDFLVQVPSNIYPIKN